MTGHKHLFAEITELARIFSFGDASKIENKGKDNVKFLQKNEKLRMVKNVYYIPEMKSNILSMGQLMKKKFEIFMKKWILHLKDSRRRAIARVEMRDNRMFKLNLQRIEQKYLKINNEDKA
jgi:hypothetical protein